MKFLAKHAIVSEMWFIKTQIYENEDDIKITTSNRRPAIAQLVERRTVDVQMLISLGHRFDSGSREADLFSSHYCEISNSTIPTEPLQSIIKAAYKKLLVSCVNVGPLRFKLDWPEMETRQRCKLSCSGLNKCSFRFVYKQICSSMVQT